MVDKVLMNRNLNCAVIYYTNGRSFVLTASKDVSIERFYEWFVSNEYYTLLTDAQFKSSMEDTINLKVEELGKAA